MLPLRVIFILIGDIAHCPSLARVIGLVFVLSNIILIITNLNKIAQIRIIRTPFVILLLLIFLYSFRPVFAYVFTQDLNDFTYFLKLLSWTTIIPLAAVAFQTVSDIRHLRYSALLSFGIIVIALIIGNIFEIGHTAYNFGMFYIVFNNSGPLSMVLVTFLPFFFLPAGEYLKEKPISVFTIFLVLVDFCFILLLLKRSCILAFIISCSIILFLFAINKYVDFSMKGFWVIAFAFILLVSTMVTNLLIINPDIIEKRFLRDVNKYEKSGELAKLGSGRIGIFVDYSAYFFKQSLLQQFIGVDIRSYIDKSKADYFRIGFKLVPHNDYMNCLMSSGLLGLILFLWLLLSILLRMWKVFRFSEDLLAVRLSVVMLGMFSIYLVSSIAGVMNFVLAMIYFAMLFGASLGVASCDNSLRSHSLTNC